jgi:hypothetical protein
MQLSHSSITEILMVTQFLTISSATMYFKFLIAVVILNFFAVSCTVNAVHHDASNAAANDEEEEQTTSLLRRGLASWKPAWWERIKNSYKGNDLKLCPSRSAPAKGSWCERKKTTCFFGNKTCPTVGANPTVKCVCNGTRTKKGRWSCTPETVPCTCSYSGRVSVQSRPCVQCPNESSQFQGLARL